VKIEDEKEEPIMTIEINSKGEEILIMEVKSIKGK
jgi:hypothetical protein